MLISEDYREQNRLLHEKKRRSYGGEIKEHRVREIGDFRRLTGSLDILDYGCGKGLLSQHLEGVRNYDPALPEFAALPEAADLVVCCDVLEHVEPACLEDVLAHLSGLTKRALYLTIALTEDRKKRLPDGRNPHLIVQKPGWWLHILDAACPFVAAHGYRYDVTDKTLKVESW